MIAFNVINAILVFVGVPAILAAAIYIGRKLQTLDNLEKLGEAMKHNIGTIASFLTRNHSSFNSSELKTMSPITLTEQGNKLIDELGFDEVLKNHKKDFFDFIDSENPKLKYDVETASIKSIYFLADKPYMEFLKVFLYNNPKRSMNDVAPTLGVYVRDEYLKGHQEITQ